MRMSQSMLIGWIAVLCATPLAHAMGKSPRTTEKQDEPMWERSPEERAGQAPQNRPGMSIDPDSTLDMSDPSNMPTKTPSQAPSPDIIPPTEAGSNQTWSK